MIVAAFSNLVVVDFPDEACALVFVRNHAHDALAELFVGFLDALTKSWLDSWIGAVTVQGLEDQEVNVHPNGRSPIVVTLSVVRVVFAERSHTEVSQHGRLCIDEHLKRRFEPLIARIKDIQEKWPEVEVASVSLKSFLSGFL